MLVFFHLEHFSNFCDSITLDLTLQSLEGIPALFCDTGPLLVPPATISALLESLSQLWLFMELLFIICLLTVRLNASRGHIYLCIVSLMLSTGNGLYRC